MNKRLIALLLLLPLAAAVFYGAYAQAAQRELAGKLLRLHIIANSDSAADQELKLKVRDRVLSALENSDELIDARMYLSENAGKIKACARDEVIKNGFDYPVRVDFVKMYFPTREYESFSLPAGLYNAVRLEIGEGKGQNWWCVMFPPLCLSAACEFEETAKQAGMSDEEIKLLKSGKTVYRFKFKTLEIIRGIEEFFR